MTPAQLPGNTSGLRTHWSYSIPYTNPGFKLDGAVALWRKGRVTLAKAAEVAGLTVPEFKEVLAARGIIRETGGKSGEEMAEKLKAVWP